MNRFYTYNQIVGTQGEKATWYDQMRTTVKTGMPLVQGVVAWSTTNVKEGNTYDWNVDSSLNSLLAWKAMGDDPYFRPLE